MARQTSSNKSSQKAKENKNSSSRKRASSKKQPQKKSIVMRIFMWLVLIGLLCALLGGSVVLGAFWYYSKTLPGIFSYDDYKPNQMTIIYDKMGEPILELADEKRIVIPFSDIPEHMKKAMIASEDANFYQHKGLDYVGIVRAVITNVRRGGFSQGSSTITQQVVKNLLLTPEKHLSRKIQEVLLARQLEQSLTKDEILAIYLNHVYFGHRNYGVERAAQFYFGVHAKDLNVSQAATIAGLVQSPEKLSPKKHPEAAKARRNYVLRRMYETGFINEGTYRSTIEEPIVLKEADKGHIGLGPYFAAYVRKQLEAEFGPEFVEKGGLHVYTTLDPEMQRMAEAALVNGLHNFDNRHYMNKPLNKPTKKTPKSFKKDTNYEAKITKIDKDTVYFKLGDKELPYAPTNRQKKQGPIEETFKVGDTWFVQVAEFEKDAPSKIFIPSGANGALIAIDPETREVRALVGGYSYKESNFNRATQAQRQTGSSFKTFVYGAGLESHTITPSTIIDDAPKVFHIDDKKKPWSPKNSDGKFKGPMTTRTALALSRNTVAVDVLERTGIEKTIEFVRRLGINSPLDNGYTLALGSSSLNMLEVTNAYATIIDGGKYKSPVFVTKITQGPNSLPIKPQTKHTAIAPDVAYVLADMLKSVAVEGTAKKYLKSFGRDVGGKTGTTNSTKDAWFVGFTQDLACGVYVGYDDPPKPLGKGEGGSTTALPIFAEFMKEYHKDLPVRNFEKPSSVIELDVDAATGLLVRDPTQKTRHEVFLPGTQPTNYAPAPDSENNQDWMLRQLDTTQLDDVVDTASDDDDGF